MVKIKKDWHELISQTEYKVAEDRNVYVTMRDGVRLAVNIFRPEARGKFPALISLSPYGKEIQELLLPPQPLNKSPLWDGIIEAGDIGDVVSRGYVQVIGDMRGSGKSEGETSGIFNPIEGKDAADVIEWAAKQPWCNGNVGMLGYSYFSEVQLAAAVEQPPHLKAIFTSGSSVDLYRGEAYPGGVLCLFLYGLWDGRTGISGFSPKNFVSQMVKELPKKEFERRRQALLNNPDIRAFPNLYHLLNCPQKNPVFFDLLMNPYDGPYYWERTVATRLKDIKIPVYSVGAWTHFYTTRGQIDLYAGLKSTKKLMMHRAGTVTRPWRADFDVIIRWYDHWLKGIDTGIMDEPPIKIFVMGINKWRYENEWPLPQTRPTKFYLRPWEELSDEPELYQNDPDCYLQQPLHLSQKRDSVKYLSAPMADDLEATGPAAFYFYAAIDQDDTNWIVKLSDVDDHGFEQPMGTAYLKASHRALDKKKSTPLAPYHPHTSSEQIVPGEVYEYAIPLVPLSNVFKVGHRIKLEIGSMDSHRDPDMQLHFHPHLCSSKTVVHKIYRNKQYQSHLLLPVIPNR